VISRIESNNLASIRLHESCGFKRVGLLEDVGEKFNQSLSVALMQYHVTAG
jgi:L-amino acid N-acyltransferase